MTYPTAHMPCLALRLVIGLTATLAGLDTFFDLLANWTAWIKSAGRTDAPDRGRATAQ